MIYFDVNLKEKTEISKILPKRADLGHHVTRSIFPKLAILALVQLALPIWNTSKYSYLVPGKDPVVIVSPAAR